MEASVVACLRRWRGGGRSPCCRERGHRPCRADATGLELLEARDPRLPVVRRAVGGPGKAIGLDRVITDPPPRRRAGRQAERLLDPHLSPVPLPGAHVLQSCPAVRSDDLPAVESTVVIA